MPENARSHAAVRESGEGCAVIIDGPQNIIYRARRAFEGFGLRPGTGAS